MADAVAASCAIPGFYHPVKVAGRRYVDGGICSTSNLDLLCGADLDLVVCLNPMSSVAPVAGGSPADRFARVMRAPRGAAWPTRPASSAPRAPTSLILQPGREDCALMGLNLMSGSRRVQVMEQARKSAARGAAPPAREDGPAARALAPPSRPRRPRGLRCGARRLAPTYNAPVQGE